MRRRDGKSLFAIEEVMEWHSDHILDAAEHAQHSWNENCARPTSTQF